jgi:carbon-monoxide dehydrogenase medium subunit
MAAGLVDRQVRNRGTIGGNVCLNDPTNNFPPLLVALGARFNVLGPEGNRTINADDYFVGTLTTALGTGELLVSIEIPPLPDGARIVHRHLQVGADSWAMARAVVRIDEENGVVVGARIVVGAVLGSPQRLRLVERALVGRSVGTDLDGPVAEAFDHESIETVDDVHCSADYRRQMSKVQLRRALRDLAKGSTQ